MKNYKYKADDIQIFVMSHNRAHFIKDCINSILAQTAGVSEITVLDNESTDDTEAVVKGYEHKGVKYIKTYGFLGNFKKSQELAYKKYVMVFHDDDILHPTYLEMALKILNEQDDISLITTRYTTFKGELPIFENNLKPSYYLFDKCRDFTAFMYYNEQIAFASAIYRTEEYVKNDLEYDKFSKYNDWPFMVKIAVSGKSVIVVDGRMYYSRIHPNQDSSTNVICPSIEQIINWDKFFYEKLEADKIFSIKHYAFMNKFEYFLLGKYRHALREEDRAKISEEELLHLAEKAGIRKNGFNLLYNLFKIPKVNKYFVKKLTTKYVKIHSI